MEHGYSYNLSLGWTRTQKITAVEAWKNSMYIYKEKVTKAQEEAKLAEEARLKEFDTMVESYRVSIYMAIHEQINKGIFSIFFNSETLCPNYKYLEAFLYVLQELKADGFKITECMGKLCSSPSYEVSWARTTNMEND